jgi:hypothetical protein
MNIYILLDKYGFTSIGGGYRLVEHSVVLNISPVNNPMYEVLDYQNQKSATNHVSEVESFIKAAIRKNKIRKALM